MLHNIKIKILPQLLIIYTRYLLGLAFVFASIIKIKGLRFTGSDGINSPIDTSWHFFETMYQSGLYWQFLGLGQLLAGGLLMTQRYTKLGAIVFLPIIANVFVITISYDFNGTPIVTGLMLLANILLILWDWDTLKFLVNQEPQKPLNNRISDHPIWEITGLLLFLFTAVYRIITDEYNLFLWIGGCTVIGLIGLVIGLSRVRP